MYILGINSGHNSTAALLKNGKIIGCVSEERFSRIKNHFGFPYQSVKYLLDFAGITTKKIDLLVLTMGRGDNMKLKASAFTNFFDNYTKKSFSKK